MSQKREDYPTETSLYLIFKTTLATIMATGLILTSAPVFGDEQQETQEIQSDTGQTMNFVDRYHGYLLGRVNQPAVWFDNFFGDPITDDEELPTSFVRMRISAQYTEGDGFKFPIRLRANIKLPRASRKLRLIVVGENEDELLTARSREEPTDGTGEETDEERSSIGLRYTLYKTIRSILHFGGGTRNLSPFEYYGRISYRRIIHSGSNNVIRFKQSGFWNSIDGFGETSRFDLERALDHDITARLSLYGTYYDSDPNTEANNGLNWGVESSFFKHLTKKTAASFDIGAYGVTRPNTAATNHRIASRIRTNILRPWLFFEFEPAVSFYKSETREAVGSIMVMMEIQFAST